MKFKIICKEVQYKGFFSLETYEFQHELFRGGWSGIFKREVFERGNAVAVLIHDPVADTLLLTEQFRPGAIRHKDTAWMTEIVAGIVEEGEDNEDVARREAQEEAGCQLNELEHMLDYYPSPGASTELVSLYYAPLDLSKVEAGIHGLESENEDIRISIVPRKKVMEWLRSGKINSSLAVISLQWLALERP